MAEIVFTSRQAAFAGGCLVLLLGTGAFFVISASRGGHYEINTPQEPMLLTATQVPQSQPAQVSTPAPVARPAPKVYPKEISYGSEVDIKDYAVEGKMMIFDFTSPYCPPCRQVAPRLEKLHFDRDEVMVVRVNINRPGVQGIDFQSPVARKYHLPFVPYFVVMAADRSNVIQGRTASDMVYRMLAENERR